MAVTRLILLIFLMSGCLGHGLAAHTQGAAAVAYSSPGGTTGVAAYSYQTGTKKSHPNSLPPGAARPQQASSGYPPSQSALGRNAGPPNSNRATYSQASAYSGPASQYTGNQPPAHQQTPPRSLPQGAALPKVIVPGDSYRVWSAGVPPPSPGTRRNHASLPAGAAPAQQPAPAGHPTTRGMTKPRGGPFSGYHPPGSAPPRQATPGSSTTVGMAPPTSHSKQGTPASLPAGAALPRPPAPAGNPATRGMQPHASHTPQATHAGAPPPPLQSSAGRRGPFPPPLSHTAPSAPTHLPLGAASPRQPARLPPPPAGRSGPYPPLPSYIPPVVPSSLPRGALPPQQPAFFPPPPPQVPIGPPALPPRPLGIAPAALPPGAATRQSAAPANFNQPRFPPPGVKKTMSFMERVAQREAEIDHHYRMVLASGPFMINAQPQAVMNFVPPIFPAPALYQQQPATFQRQEPVFDQFSQPVQAPYRLDAARDLDCETVPEVQSLNVDVYHPMGCDDDVCPKGKVCRTIAGVGMCCPPSVTGDVITSKGRLGQVEHLGLGWT